MSETYYFELIIPGLVRVHEDVASYPLTEAQIIENLEHVKSHRSSYDDDAAYLRRVQFYEQALETLKGNIQ